MASFNADSSDNNLEKAYDTAVTTDVTATFEHLLAQRDRFFEKLVRREHSSPNTTFD